MLAPPVTLPRPPGRGPESTACGIHRLACGQIHAFTGAAAGLITGCCRERKLVDLSKWQPLFQQQAASPPRRYRRGYMVMRC